jgi:polyhydroxyalkanoate synthesis regulator phasin
MPSNCSLYRLLFISLFIAICFSCVAYADATEAVAEKILQAKRNAQQFQKELSDEIEHIHNELISQATPTLSPLSVSSTQAVQNTNFVQMLRDGLPVISNINAAQDMNAAQEALLTDAISLLKDDKTRNSYQSRLAKLSSARTDYDKKVESILTALQKEINEVNPEFPPLHFSSSSAQLSLWVDELQNYIRNNPYSLKNHSFTSVENSLSELKVLLSWMDSLGEELTTLERDLLAL